MNDPIDVAAKQIKEVMEAMRTIADTIATDNEKEVKFCLTVVGLVHQYLFKEAPKEATMHVNKMDYPH